jgi:hypothetical protein
MRRRKNRLEELKVLQATFLSSIALTLQAV